MPREAIYIVVGLFGAVVCLVVVVGLRDEIRQPPSLRRRLTVLVALALALFAVWSMVWPVVAPEGQYCGVAPSVLTDTASDLALWGNSPAAGAHDACSAYRWLRFLVGVAAGVASVVMLGFSRGNRSGST
jgi:fatty acid desaturase